MNELKQYVNEWIARYKISRPASYNDSFYSSIKGPVDIERIITHAENFIAGYESNNHPGYKDDVEDRAREVYQCFTALRKIGQAMSEISAVHSVYDEITREQIDDWFNRFDLIKQKADELHTRFVLRPDLYR